MELNLPQNEDLSIIELLLTQDKDNIELAKQLFAGLYPDMSELEFLTKYHYDVFYERSEYLNFDNFIFRNPLTIYCDDIYDLDTNIHYPNKLYYLNRIKLPILCKSLFLRVTEECIDNADIDIPKQIEYLSISVSNKNVVINNLPEKIKLFKCSFKK